MSGREAGKSRLLEGRAALVTGAAKRIGRTLALALAGEGARVAVHHHRSAEEAEETARLAGNGARTFRADLSSVAEAEGLAEDVHRAFGRIDVVIHNAALFGRTPFGETTERDWDRFHAVNLKAPFFLSQAAAARMGEGSILFIADVCALDPWPGYLAYGATKAGLIHLTRGLARALAPRIRVNAILPGPILPSEPEGAESLDEAVARTLLKRRGDPSDIASAALFLTAEACYVTGAVLPVDGGRHLGSR
ncbi:MAG: SDR family oxidoreductase [Candidatus Eisenbacteria bacterium]|nr:SDR family oxidoreductase [Candidatus Eisenbacteria bacterium]